MRNELADIFDQDTNKLAAVQVGEGFLFIVLLVYFLLDLFNFNFRPSQVNIHSYQHVIHFTQTLSHERCSVLFVISMLKK